MSHRIEYQKRVVHVEAPETDKRFSGHNHLFFYLSSGCDNNVTPHTPDWTMASLHTDHEPKNTWAGEFLLPSRIWAMAAAADSGSIQTREGYISGLKYIEAWKDAAENAVDLPLTGKLPWTPTLLAHHGVPDEKEIALTADACHVKQINEAFARLNWEGDGRWKTCRIGTASQLLDAAFLLECKDEIATRLYLEDGPRSAFLKRGPAPKPQEGNSTTAYLPTTQESAPPATAQTL